MFQAYCYQIPLHQRSHSVERDYLVVQKDARDDCRWFNQIFWPDYIQEICKMSGFYDRSRSNGDERSRVEIGNKGINKQAG